MFRNQVHWVIKSALSNASKPKEITIVKTFTKALIVLNVLIFGASCAGFGDSTLGVCNLLVAILLICFL